MSDRDLEQRVEILGKELAVLKEQVAALMRTAETAAPLPIQTSPPVTAGGDAGEEILDWMGKSSLLPRVAAVCFLLVVALVLRTVTDNGLVAPQVGSLAGMAYAALLIGAGWYSYRRSLALAPIFTVCGALLMYVIVGESHARFDSLPSLAAYAILLLTGGVTATISYRSGRPLPVLIGTLGMGLAGVAIDYPTPYYPYLALLLLIANLFGAFATRLQSCSWLRWILLILTALMMQVWAMKLSLAGRQRLDPNVLAEPLFLPVLSLLAAVLFGVAILAALRRGGERVSRFDLCLPTATALWVFGAAAYVLRTQQVHLVLLGLFGLILAGGAAILAKAFHRRGESRNGAAIAYMVAATALLGMGMWAFSGGALSALVVLSLAAWRLALLGKAWALDGLRGISYLLQVAGGVSFAILAFERGPTADPYAQMLAAGLLAAVGMWHYGWCRLFPAVGNSDLLNKVDRDDRSVVLLLLSALLCGFLLVRTGLYLVFSGAAAVAGAYQAGQSVVIATAAAGLMLFAFLRRRDRELRNVAILVTLVAAGRVFLLDLFQVRGVALVVSVFTFGVTISLISLALTRWSRRPFGEEGKKTPGAVEG